MHLSKRVHHCGSIACRCNRAFGYRRGIRVVVTLRLAKRVTDRVSLAETTRLAKRVIQGDVRLARRVTDGISLAVTMRLAKRVTQSDTP